MDNMNGFARIIYFLVINLIFSTAVNAECYKQWYATSGQVGAYWWYPGTGFMNAPELACEDYMNFIIISKPYYENVGYSVVDSGFSNEALGCYLSYTYNGVQYDGAVSYNRDDLFEPIYVMYFYNGKQYAPADFAQLGVQCEELPPEKNYGGCGDYSESDALSAFVGK